MSDDMRSCLGSYYARAFPARQGVRVTALAHISAGWESNMYSFNVEYGSAGARQCEELILRIYPGDDAHNKSAREYRGMSLLHKTQVRVSEQDTTRSDSGNPYAYVDRELDRVRPYMARFPIPGFVPIAEWLEKRRDLVPCERPSVIHWDYHPGNILLCDDGAAVVVDCT